MDSGMIAQIITIIFIILGAIGVNLAGFYKVLKALKESADLPTVLSRVLADRKVTEAEVDEVIKEFNEAKGAWADVYMGKK